MFANGSWRNEMLRNKFRFIWASSFRGEDFKKIFPIRKMNCLWRPCLVTDWEKMSSLNREPSIDAKYPVSIHLNKWFKKRRVTCEKLTDDRRRTSSDDKSSLCFVNVIYKVFVTQHIYRQMYSFNRKQLFAIYNSRNKYDIINLCI